MTAIEQRDGELSNAETMPAETGPHCGALGKIELARSASFTGDIGTRPLYAQNLWPRCNADRQSTREGSKCPILQQMPTFNASGFC